MIFVDDYLDSTQTLVVDNPKRTLYNRFFYRLAYISIYLLLIYDRILWLKIAFKYGSVLRKKSSNGQTPKYTSAKYRN